MKTNVWQDTARQLEPELVVGSSHAATVEGGVLSTAQVDQWRCGGYLLVDGLFPDSLVAGLRADALAKFPAPQALKHGL